MPFIQLPGDSTGKLVETVTPSLSSVGGSTAHREVMVLGDYTSTALGPLTTTGGLLVAISNPSTAATVTQGTSPWIVHFTSGVLSTATQATVITGTSSGIAPVTTSGGLGVTILGGAAAGSTAVNIVGSGSFAPVTTSFGLLSNFSSGSYLIRSLSSGTVTATAATNPWSSAPSFNVPIVSASSGLVQVFVTGTSGAIVPATSSGGLLVVISAGTVISASSGNVGIFPSTSRTYTVFVFNSSSSNSITNITTAAAILYGWNVGNQTTSGTASVKMFNSTTATVGSTTNLLQTIPIPGGSAGAGNNLMLPQGVVYSGGITFALTANFAATSTGAVAANDVVGTIYYSL